VFAAESLSLVAVATAIALLVPSFMTLLQYVGAITGTLFSFTLPGLFYLKLMGGPFFNSPTKIGALSLLILGSSAGIISTILIIRSDI